MNRPRRVALSCAAVALATSGVAVGASLSAADWNTSALVRMSDVEPMATVAREHDPNFAFVPFTSHYDGVYFYAIALDPLGRDPRMRAEPVALIDRAAYRYGHAGYGWMAWAASLGRPSALPTTMLILALAGIAVGAGAASLLAHEAGFTPWAGLAVALNPGIVYAATVLTSETVGVGLLMLGVLAWVRERRVAAAIVLAAACLTKEPFLLVPVGLGLWELIRGLRRRGTAWLAAPELWRRAGLLLAGPALFGAWYVYLIARFDEVPHTLVSDLTTWPFLGWWSSFRQAAQVGLGRFSFDQVQLATASVSLLAATGAALAAGLVAGTRMRNPASLVFIGLALVAFGLTPLGVFYPKDLIREVSMPLALLPFAFAGRHREPDLVGEPAEAFVG